MSYIINKTDGSVLTEVVDGTIDQITTDVTLVGKNATTYGELFNENFVKILENFANTSQPNNPLEGQLWYDTTEGRLKVYDGTGFKVSGGTIVATNIPSSIAAGDIWIDSYRQQMYFNDGNSTLLAGPAYSAQQGITGLQVTDVLDTNQINHTVVFLYVGQVLLGIFSNANFVPLETIPGFSADSIKVGFTSAYSAVKFNVPSSQADTLTAQDGSAKTAESFLQVDPADGYVVANGTIRILNNNALVLGANQNSEITLANNALQVVSNIINQNFEIKSFNGEGVKSSIFVNAANEWIGLYTDTPTATLDVNGSVRIRENLVVEGNITSVNQTEINIEDTVINLGKTTNPSDDTADGGGILLEGGGDGDKTLLWNLSHESWDSSENVNLASSKVYKINNFEVLSQTQLGNTVTNAPGLNSIGQLNNLQVDNINVNGSTISFYNVGVPNGSIVLAPSGSGTVNLSSKKISNLASPTDGADAVNLSTMTAAVRSVPMGFSVDIGILNESQLATNVLTKIFRPADFDENTYLRVWCQDISVAKEYRLIGPSWIYQGDI